MDLKAEVYFPRVHFLVGRLMPSLEDKLLPRLGQACLQMGKNDLVICRVMPTVTVSSFKEKKNVLMKVKFRLMKM